MPKNSKSFLPLITAAIFISMEIAAVAMLKSSSALQDVWINRASHRVVGSLWSGGESIRNHFSLAKQDDALMQENFELKERIRDFELYQEATVEATLSASGDRRFVYIPATVVKMSRNSMHNYIILNKGSEDGVTAHCGIITGKGVVGIVSAVDKHYSYGLTLMNTNVSVSSRVESSGMVSPLVWDGVNSNQGVLKDIPLHYTIEPGDTVVTSGFSNIFPADIPVGITGETEIVYGSTSQTAVTLFQDFGALRYVTIVKNPARDEVSALEEREEKR